jgi:hypothetical protein
MYLSRRQTVKFLKAHDERVPFVWIDAVGVAIEKKIRAHMHALDSQLEDIDGAT